MTNYSEKLNSVEYDRNKYTKLAKQANIIIEQLEKSFVKKDINIPDLTVEDNCIKFTFWGLKFIIKTEFLFANKETVFNQAEINTYLILEESEQLILTYLFDSIGNINNFHRMEEFPKYYYIDFVTNLYEFSKNKGVKFQLL